MLQGEHSAQLATFIKPQFVIKTFVLSIFECPFYTGFSVLNEWPFKTGFTVQSCLFQFWDAATGVLKCVYGESEIGVTGVNFVSKR